MTTTEQAAGAAGATEARLVIGDRELVLPIERAVDGQSAINSRRCSRS